MKQVFSGLAFLLLLSAPCLAQGIPDGAVAAFSASYASEASGDYSKAISDLRAVYGEGFYEANLRLGWLYLKKKDYEQSQKYYRQAIRNRPASIEALFAFVTPAAAAQNWAEVFTTYGKILSIDPNNSLANYRLALMYYYRKEYAAAEKQLQKVVERYPFDYDIVLLSAQVKLALGKLGESKAYYQRALLYNPSNNDIKAVLGKL